jgi:hydrogenase expression/formation protein HypC
MHGDAADGDASFALPSRMNQDEVLALAGAASSPTLEKSP